MASVRFYEELAARHTGDLRLDLMYRLSKSGVADERVIPAVRQVELAKRYTWHETFRK